MTQLDENLKEIYERVAEAALRSGRNAEEIHIMAVTKTVSPELVNRAIEQGIRLLGENRVQEFLDKQKQYAPVSEGIHFIGHLQTNKVKYIIDKVDMIESVGSLKLAEEIEKRAAQLDRRMPVLLEVNISAEETKSGFLPEMVFEAFRSISALPHLEVSGLMAIPQKGNGGYYFQKLHELFEEMRVCAEDKKIFSVLSMGMSADYEEAILHGSTLIRLGTALFGKRN